MGRRTAQVQEVWIFGSRATGRAALTSDLDVAIRIAPDPADESLDATDTWIRHVDRWRHENLLAQSGSSFTYNDSMEHKKVIEPAVRREGILIYSRRGEKLRH
jgi:predicted nucleotidyltransferase